MDLAGIGVLVPRVAIQLPMEQAAEAHRRTERGGLRGRIVLTFDHQPLAWTLGTRMGPLGKELVHLGACVGVLPAIRAPGSTWGALAVHPLPGYFTARESTVP